MTTWLMTRAGDEARPERDWLAARSCVGVEVPCLQVKFLRWPWSAAAHTDVTLFTSRRAIEAWVLAGRPALGQVASVSPSTSEALRREGVAVALAVEGGVVRLAQRVVDAGLGRAFRYPTSNAGVRSAEQAVAVERLSTVGPVDRRVVYEVSARPGLGEALVKCIGVSAWRITFASPSAIEAFFGALEPAHPPEEVLCVGQSTARAWDECRPAGWSTVSVQSLQMKGETP
jgi:uroporphyrinogen-III synthase